MKTTNLKKDESKLITLKTKKLLEQQEGTKSKSKKTRRSKAKPKVAPQLQNKSKLLKNYSIDTSRTCIGCVHSHSNGEWCTLYKEIIFDDKLYAFSCDSYQE